MVGKCLLYLFSGLQLLCTHCITLQITKIQEVLIHGIFQVLKFLSYLCLNYQKTWRVNSVVIYATQQNVCFYCPTHTAVIKISLWLLVLGKFIGSDTICVALPLSWLCSEIIWFCLLSLDPCIYSLPSYILISA